METIAELRAGQMLLREGRLVPDTRKGLIRVCQDEAGLVHFCWFERDASGQVASQPERDIVVVLPGECTFGKIPRPGSRVFELRFPEERDRDLFFWAQGAAPAEDDGQVAAVNQALSLADGGDERGQQAVGMEAEAGQGQGQAAAPTAAAAAAGAGGIAAADLAAVLGSIMSGGVAAAATAQQRQQQRAADPGPSLADVLRPEALAPLLRAPDMAARLAPYLPEEHRSPAAIAELVSSPQFRHQLELFNHALMTGQLDTSQFGLPPGGFGVLDFLQGIQARADGEAAARQGQQGGDGAQP